MAKISAGGAHKLLEATAASGNFTWILCSDGRVLRRWAASMGASSLTVVGNFRRNRPKLSEADMVNEFKATCAENGFTVRG